MNRRIAALIAVVVSMTSALVLILALSRVASSQEPSDIYSTKTSITIANESFEGAFPPTGWSASGHWGKANCEAALGSFSAWAEGTGGLPCTGLGNVYHPNENSQLKFGPFDLSDATGARLDFDLWLWSAEGDTFSWEASIDGINFAGLSTADVFSARWEAHSLDLSVVPGLGDLRGEDEVWIAFTWQADNFAEAFGGAYVDNVRITKEIAVGDTPTPTATATQTAPTGESAHLPVILNPLPPSPTPTPTATSTPVVTPTATSTNTPGNHPPAFPSPFRSSSSTSYEYDSSGRLVGASTTITILSPATDPDGDSVTYHWSATNGAMSGNGLIGTWERVIANGKVQGGTVTITADDGKGGMAEAELVFH